jgi:hypothetical protein
MEKREVYAKIDEATEAIGEAKTLFDQGGRDGQAIDGLTIAIARLREARMAAAT